MDCSTYAASQKHVEGREGADPSYDRIETILVIFHVRALIFLFEAIGLFIPMINKQPQEPSKSFDFSKVQLYHA